MWMKSAVNVLLTYVMDRKFVHHSAGMLHSGVSKIALRTQISQRNINQVHVIRGLDEDDRSE